VSLIDVAPEPEKLAEAAGKISDDAEGAAVDSQVLSAQIARPATALYQALFAIIWGRSDLIPSGGWSICSNASTVSGAREAGNDFCG